MAHGFFRVAAAAPPVKVADCPCNADTLLKEIKAAENQNIRLILFPELALSGYTCGDLFFQQTLLYAVESELSRLIEATKQMRLLVCAGFPFAHSHRLYNAAAVFGHGRLYGIVGKRHLPNYAEFYEKRYFSPVPDKTETVTFAGHECPFGGLQVFDIVTEDGTFPFGVEICEDLWSLTPPSERLVAEGALLILNPSASNEAVGKTAFRRTLLEAQSGRLHAAYLYAGCGRGESTGDLVFGGYRAVVENGTVLEDSAPFDDRSVVCDIDFSRLLHDRRRNSGFAEDAVILPVCRTTVTMPNSSGEDEKLLRNVSPLPFVPAENSERESRCREILRLQAEGLAQRLRQTGLKQVVLGLSGGLDSTLALLVAVTAFDLLQLPREGILCVTMPGYGTTSRTKNNATGLAKAAGAVLKEIPIHEAVAVHFRDIGHDPEVTDTVYENAQARERTQILMDLANKSGALVLGTGDLSELALGWATFNGDHMSMYGVNASVPKTLIRYLVRTYADTVRRKSCRMAEILEDVLATPVSPELLPPKNGEIAQCTESIVGPYELHDFFLYYMLRWGFSPKKIVYLARYAFTEENGCCYSRDVLLKWMEIFYRRFFGQQFKRNCLPEGPKVGSVSLSPRGDWRMPGDAEASLWLEEIGKMVQNA